MYAGAFTGPQRSMITITLIRDGLVRIGHCVEKLRRFSYVGRRSRHVVAGRSSITEGKLLDLAALAVGLRMQDSRVMSLRMAVFVWLGVSFIPTVFSLPAIALEHVGLISIPGSAFYVVLATSLLLSLGAIALIKVVWWRRLLLIVGAVGLLAAQVIVLGIIALMSGGLQGVQ